jgi:hypothetical protein
LTAWVASVGALQFESGVEVAPPMIRIAITAAAFDAVQA